MIDSFERNKNIVLFLFTVNHNRQSPDAKGLAG